MPERFWRRVEKTEGCWLWMGCRLKGGYGRLWYVDRLVLAHRLAYFLTFGEIPTSINILHDCDNPPCVKPGHLFLGTQADNVHDAIRKGRDVSSPGELNGGARLSELQVLEIRRLYECGKIRSRLAADYKVNWSTINRIIRKQTWRNL